MREIRVGGTILRPDADPVPYIHLTEDMLRSTGFKAGDKITVEAKTDLIVIYSTPEE